MGFGSFLLKLLTYTAESSAAADRKILNDKLRSNGEFTRQDFMRYARVQDKHLLEQKSSLQAQANELREMKKILEEKENAVGISSKEKKEISIKIDEINDSMRDILNEIAEINHERQELRNSLRD